MTPPDLHAYDHYVVFFSGGKDSTAAFLHLLELGVDRSKIELWHHQIDGQEGSTLMDWPCTPDYCRQFARAFNVPIYFSWRENGFEGEMTKHNSKSGGYYFEVPDDGLIYVPFKGGDNTRLMFPQMAADLSVRWCSASLKIEVGRCAARNDHRFRHKRTLFVGGERAEESPSRARYEAFARYDQDARDGKLGRHMDKWLAVHDWQEMQVWDIIRRWLVLVHPVYMLGIGRCSCQFCIFADPLQWAVAYLVSPERGQVIDAYERKFGKAIKRTGKTLLEVIAPKLEEAQAIIEEAPIYALAIGEEKYSLPIITDTFELPSGAYRRSGGPT